MDFKIKKMKKYHTLTASELWDKYQNNMTTDKEEDICKFEQLLTAWGFGYMLGDWRSFDNGKKDLNAFLAEHFGEEEDDYSFVDDNMHMYQKYLVDNAEVMTRSDMEREWL